MTEPSNIVPPDYLLLPSTSQSLRTLIFKSAIHLPPECVRFGIRMIGGEPFIDTAYVKAHQQLNESLDLGKCTCYATQLTRKEAFNALIHGGIIVPYKRIFRIYENGRKAAIHELGDRDDLDSENPSTS
jgi:hypothetical protein